MALTLKPEVKAVLERLGAAQGKPAATATADLLEQMAPIVDQLAQAMEQAATAPQRTLEMLADTLLDAQAIAAQGQLEIREARRKAEGNGGD